MVEPLDHITVLMNKLPKVSLNDARRILTESYETTYGIKNHFDSTNSPFAYIEFNTAEDFHSLELLGPLVDMYLDNEIGDLYKLDIKEFLANDKTFNQLLVSRATKFRARKAKLADEAKRRMEQEYFNDQVMGKK